MNPRLVSKGEQASVQASRGVRRRGARAWRAHGLRATLCLSVSQAVCPLAQPECKWLRLCCLTVVQIIFEMRVLLTLIIFICSALVLWTIAGIIRQQSCRVRGTLWQSIPAVCRDYAEGAALHMFACNRLKALCPCILHALVDRCVAAGGVWQRAPALCGPAGRQVLQQPPPHQHAPGLQ